jgi:hypothetical protein
MKVKAWQVQVFGTLRIVQRPQDSPDPRNARALKPLGFAVSK